MKVLFCADGSDPSLQAIDKIPAFLMECAQINVLYVVDTGFFPTLPSLISDNILQNYEDTARDIVDETKKRIEAKGFKVESALYLQGSPPDVILNEINEKNYDLVIFGASKKPGIRRWLGSVSRRVVYKSQIPVLIIRPPQIKPVINLRPKPYILFSTDGSACSYNAIKKACNIFNIKQFDVDILTVKLGAESLPLEIVMDNEWLEKSLAAQDELAGEILDTAEKILNENSINVRARYALEGHPTDEILKFLDKNEPDVIVMGSHGREGFSDMLLGSISKSVLDSSDVHVLIIPLK